MRLLFLLAVCTAMAAPGVKTRPLPLSFEPNTGQAAEDVRYLARSGPLNLYFSNGEIVLAGHGQRPLRTKLLRANTASLLAAEDRQASTSNYFVGKDPGKWRTSVPNYQKVRYGGVYSGIDLIYYGNDGALEYDWIVSPGADPRKIRMAFEGADRVRIDGLGALIIQQGKTEYRHKKPGVYQEIAGHRVPVEGSWILHGREGAFRIGTYDRRLPLVIDPVLLYSTYEGGTGLDYAYGVAVDAAGNTYVTGTTGSVNLPTAGPFQAGLRGVTDVFVTKISPGGTSKIYSTYLGGGGPDEGKGIAVDSQGNAYVTGNAGSFDFPMQGAIQPIWGGSGDAFLTKLNPTGTALVYSTYLGGNAIDNGTGVAVDPVGNAYIVGITFSTNFPTVAAFQRAKGAQQDAFVAKINPSGSAWIYSTYLGGDAVDEGYGIAVDSTGNAYVTGYTGSTNFPLQSPIRSSNLASVDAFVTKINPAGSALVYSTYLGGSGTDYGTAIAVDTSGSAYVTGNVESKDFPLVNPMQLKIGGAADAFVAKLDPSGRSFVYSTYLGGGSTDEAYGVAVDQLGNAYVTGRTNSSDFPLANPIQITRFAFDMFVTEMNASGSSALFSTFIGGTGSESGRGIAVDSFGNIHVAGESTSTDFPIKNAIQGANGGGPVSQDAVVLLLGDHAPPPSLALAASLSGSFVPGSSLSTYVLDVSNPLGNPATSGLVTLTDILPAGQTILAIAGDGWTCSKASVSCTRGDSLASGTSYPSVGIYVSIAYDTAENVTNQASVSGGGLGSAAVSQSIKISFPAFFTGAAALGGGNYTLQFPSSGTLFGNYNVLSFPVLHHADLGDEYFLDANDGKTGAYFYDYKTGHYFYTTPALFPYLYDFTLNAWIYYYPDATHPGHYTSSPRLFINFATGLIFTM